jgi:hypothetical protein
MSQEFSATWNAWKSDYQSKILLCGSRKKAIEYTKLYIQQFELQPVPFNSIDRQDMLNIINQHYSSYRPIAFIDTDAVDMDPSKVDISTITEWEYWKCPKGDGERIKDQIRRYHENIMMQRKQKIVKSRKYRVGPIVFVPFTPAA